MNLNIVKPTEKKTFDIQWLEIQTPVGNFIIQDQHAPMIVTLKENSEITYRLSSGGNVTEKINYGLAHINRSFITLLINK
jgi:F0F1-type ATP synthase epsilon subunit